MQVSYCLELGFKDLRKLLKMIKKKFTKSVTKLV